jgi:hypothetical protein
MKYMMFIKHTEDYAGKKAPAGLYEAMGEFVGAALQSGAMIDGAGLMPTAKGTSANCGHSRRKPGSRLRDQGRAKSNNGTASPV